MSEREQANVRARMWRHWIELDALDIGPEYRQVRQVRIATVSRVTGGRVNQIVKAARQ